MEVDSTNVLKDRFIVSVAAGSFHSFVLDKNGKPFGWGTNFFGQIGDGTQINKILPRSMPNCYGYDFSNTSFVCSGNGYCFSDNNCSCSVGFGGNVCQHHMCGNFFNFDNLVCSSRGDCVGPNQCYCSKDYAGEECQHSICFNIISNETNVCNGHGICIGPNNCSCTPGFIGIDCASLSIGFKIENFKIFFLVLVTILTFL